MEPTSTSLAMGGILGSVVGLGAPNRGVRPSKRDDRFKDIEQVSVAPDHPGRTAMRAGRDLKDYRSVAELVSGLTSWFGFYNHERPHQSLKYRTPAEVYEEAGRGSG